MRAALFAIALVSDGGAGALATGPPPGAARALRQASPASIRFSEISRQVGIDFVHFLGATGRYYFPEIAAAGCALLDYDSDGDLDVYLIQGTLLEPGKDDRDALDPPVGPTPTRNRLYRNDLISSGGERGPLRFTDVTLSSGAGDTGYGMGVATGDYDNDGDVDIYVTNFGPDVLLRNNGDGTFTDVTRDAGLGDSRWTTSASFFDFDNDGRLDLFVTAYADATLATNKECHHPGTGRREYCGPQAYPPLPDRLYKNIGAGGFEDVSASVGIDTAYGHGLGVAVGDFDDNGWMDVYVANDGDANQLWMNVRGVFTDHALVRGAALNERGMAEAGMGIAVGDHDDDGDLDIFITHLDDETNTLYESHTSGMFEDATTRRGVAANSRSFTGFGTGWFDLNNDGDLDLFIANGAVSFVEGLENERHPYRQKNQVLENDGRGRYIDVSDRAGEALALSEVSRGAAFGDIDNDGDVDLLVSNSNGPARLLRNELEDRGRWMLLRVVDRRYGRDALGARVQVTLDDGRMLTRWVRSDASYASAGDPRVHVAWPKNRRVASVRVVLPDGHAETVTGIEPGRISTIFAGPRAREGAP